MAVGLQAALELWPGTSARTNSSMAIDDSKPTVSSDDQHKVERDAASLYRPLFKYILREPDPGVIELRRKSHTSFLLRALGKLPGRAPTTCLPFQTLIGCIQRLLI